MDKVCDVRSPPLTDNFSSFRISDDELQDKEFPGFPFIVDFLSK